MKKAATLITSLESKPKVLFLLFFLHLKSWDLLTSIHQNAEEFPFCSAHFENGNFRNLSDDGTVTAINWFLKKQETEHNVPTAGNVKYIILMIAENFAKFCGTLLNREQFVQLFSDSNVEGAKNWNEFISMVRLFFIFNILGK